MDVRRMCYVLNISGFLDFLAVGMIMPLLPIHIRDLGASPTLTGFVESIYGCVQLFTSPLMGRFSDNIGRYPTILLSLVMSAVGYVLVGFSSIWVLAVGRFILGGFKQHQAICKAHMYDVLPSKEASAAIGRFHSCGNVGLIIGSIIGGHVAEFMGGVGLCAYLAAGVFMLNAGLIWWTFPVPHEKTELTSSVKSTTAPKSVEKDEASPISNQHSNQQPKDNAGGDVRTAWKWKRFFSTESLQSSPLVEFWDMLLVRFLAGLAIMMYRKNLTLNLREYFGASRTAIGYMTSYSSAISAIFGFTIGHITIRYNHDESKLFLHCLLLEIAALTCLTLSPSIPFIVLFRTPLSLGTSVMRVCSTSILVSASDQHQTASIVGWNQSINSLSRMIAPALVGLIQEWSMNAASYLSVACMTLAAVVTVSFPQDPQSRSRGKTKEKDE